MRNRFLGALAMALALSAGLQSDAAAMKPKVKREATFKVRIENISNPDGIPTADGTKYPFALSPGMYVVTGKKMEFFKLGKKADAGLEAQAEDGNPDVLAKKLLVKVGSTFTGVFNKPVGVEMPAPILPGGAYEFSFRAVEGMKLNLISMFGQSNDLFFSPKEAISLFDSKGNPLSGDITESLMLWDAGTEVNEAPGIGPDQAPRQKEKNTGAAENGVVGIVKDGFNYPNVKEVLRVTVTVE